jgi:hypothetical protein
MRLQHTVDRGEEVVAHCVVVPVESGFTVLQGREIDNLQRPRNVLHCDPNQWPLVSICVLFGRGT